MKSGFYSEKEEKCWTLEMYEAWGSKKSKWLCLDHLIWGTEEFWRAFKIVLQYPSYIKVHCIKKWLLFSELGYLKRLTFSKLAWKRKELQDREKNWTQLCYNEKWKQQRILPYLLCLNILGVFWWGGLTEQKYKGYKTFLEGSINVTNTIHLPTNEECLLLMYRAGSFQSLPLTEIKIVWSS